MNPLHEVWQSILTDGHKLGQEFLNLREILDKDFEKLMAKPTLVRPIFTLMRKIRPIFVVPHLAAVSLYPDVIEVLGNSAAFSSAPIYAKKMELTTGDFVLGMDNTPQYETEIGLMRAAVYGSDIARLKEMTANFATVQIAAAATNGGTMDAVGSLSRYVPNAIVGDYFGTPGPDAVTNMHWMRSIFREIFLNLGNDPNMAKEAEASATALDAYLDALIAQRKAELAAGTALPDDFISRLVKNQASADTPYADEVIRRMVGGTTVGTVDTNSKAIVQALQQLIDRPLTLADARNCAETGTDDEFTQFAFEALRFNPQNPFLLRKCLQDTVIAAGTSREARIKTGSLVMVGTESAMFDPDVFPEPESFRSDRPLDKYIHFGFGQHTCFGKRLATVIISETLRQIVKRPGLKAADSHGITYDGAFPNEYLIQFDA